jgi:hypothetical protein
LLNGLGTSTNVATAACADAPNIHSAVEIILDIEPPAYEASRLFVAASLLDRLSSKWVFH